MQNLLNEFLFYNLCRFCTADSALQIWRQREAESEPEKERETRKAATKFVEQTLEPLKSSHKEGKNSLFFFQKKKMKFPIY